MHRNTRGVDKKRASVAKRRVEALELRMKGYSLRAIARELGLGSAQSASNLIDGALKEIPSPKVAQYRQEIDERSRILLEQLMPIVVNKRAKREDRYAAIDRVIKIDRELRTLHGVDAPATSVQITGEVPVKDVRQQLLDRLTRLAESAAASAADRQPDG